MNRLRERRIPVEESELISCCPEEMRRYLLAAGKKRRYEKGELIFAEGDPATNVMIIEAGSAVWLREDADGRRLIVKLVGPGQSLGLPSAVAGENRLVSAEALESLTVTEIRSSAILDVMLKDAAMATRIAKIALADYVSLLEFLMAVTFHPVSHRILLLLLRLQEQGDPTGVTLRHSDLAAMAATTRETFTTQLGVLERSGLLARSEHGIHIVDPSVARSIVDGNR